MKLYPSWFSLLTRQLPIKPAAPVTTIMCLVDSGRLTVDSDLGQANAMTEKNRKVKHITALLPKQNVFLQQK